MTELSAIRSGNPLAFFNAFRCTHLEFPADERAFFVDGAHHRVAIERGAPAVVQTQHDFPAPVIGIDEPFRHTRVGDQHDFELAAAGCAGRAGDRGFRNLRVGDGFHGAQCKPVPLSCVKALTDADFTSDNPAANP